MVIRNDGKLLTPAARNPWYVLMTIAGAPSDPNDHETISKNRRFWNAWACSELKSQDRLEIAAKLGCALDEISLWSSEEKERVVLELGQRLPGTEIPCPSNAIDLRGLFFSGRMFSRGFVFPSAVLFKGSCFQDFTTFQGSQFRDIAGFEGVEFVANVDFRYVEFVQSAYFRGTSFNETGSFQGVAFQWNADFRGASFTSSGEFFGVVFNHEAYFQNTNFRLLANFDGAEFKGGGNFSNSQFGADAVFTGSVFAGSPWFEGCEFNGGVWFKKGSFMDLTSFENARFTKMVPEFFEREFYHGTVFSLQQENWPSEKATNAEVFKLLYSRLAQVMSDLHKPDDEQFFRRQEMRCKQVLEEPLPKLLLRLYGFVSDYGYSVTRPLALLSVVFVLGFLALAVGNCPAPGIDQSMQECGWGAMGLSFGNTFAFFGFGRLYFPSGFFEGLPAWLKVLGAGQTVLGVVLLFFLGLGLRNRFRLR
ncbi:hypothetical protein AIOL_000491 [Candidatus Rhodobacter oscarellae]|uniref:Pentapeptide repeat-containing protein n=2 Tax=Candidatus Rhodobacter oscarellae TaxID=1675527 RepID=A0A0J9H3T0_9RHOB|nr:hypothetical protein AIOL_000491 [Candidatus Rhodobacter lobularis]